MLSDADGDALEDIRDNIARVMRFVEGYDLDAAILILAFWPIYREKSCVLV